jgi:hypothetical protein
MKKLIQITSLFLFLVCVSALHAGFTLRDAVAGGYITFSAQSSSGYTQVKAVVKNLKSFAVDVDFSTAWLVQNNDSQRIGLVYELNTKAYYLRLAANKTYTFYFYSYCLDQSRHVPTTGTAFVSIYTIPSQFSQIINALRNNYGQSYMWSITDGSGSLVSAWKAADPRRPVGGGGGGGTTSGIKISGNVSWATSGSSINIKADKIQNLSSSSTSGYLRLRIWATRFRYTGGTINGYVLGTRSLSPLAPSYYYPNISGYVPYTRPPAGTYYTTITVEEYTASGWVIRDYVNFSNLSSF